MQQDVVVRARLRASSDNGRGQSTVVSTMVAIGVVVGWLAYYHWVYPRLVQRISDLWVIHTMTGFYLYGLVDAMLRYFGPYALVLLLWGRTGRRRLGAALCALAVGVYMWCLWVIFDKWIWGDNGTAAQVHAYEWANLLVISAGIAVAWGIARRWGRLWMFGLLAAPILAAATHELAIHSTWWRRHLVSGYQGFHGITHEMVFIAPAVITAVLCWLIELAFSRHTSDPLPAQVPEPSTSG